MGRARQKFMCSKVTRARAFHPHARAKKLSRAAECLVYSLTPSGGFGGKPPQKSGFRRHLAGSKMPEEGSKMPKETFFHGDLPLESGLAARSMPRVFGRGSRSQPAALVSDRDDAALFPAIRILERYGSAKSGRARRVRTACRRRGDPKRSSTICCRSFGLRARPSKAGPSRVPHSGERSSEQFPPRCR